MSKTSFSSILWMLPFAVTGLALFLILTPAAHPPAGITSWENEETIISESREFIEKSGYNVRGLQPNILFLSRDDLLKQQISYFGKRRFRTFIENGLLHFIPSYYWQVVWVDPTASGRDAISPLNHNQPPGKTHFRTHHTLNGGIQQFEVKNNQNLKDAPVDSVLLDIFSADETRTRPYEINLSDFPGLKDFTHGTVWDHAFQIIDSTWQTNENEKTKYHFLLRSDKNFFDHQPNVTVTLSDTGFLREIKADITIPDYEIVSQNQYLTFIRTLFYFVLILILLILFFRRLFHRVIDLRISQIYGVIAFFMALTYLSYLLFQNISNLLMMGELSQFIVIFFIILILSSLFGLMVFILSGLSESLTRKVWQDKLTSLMLLRLGYFKSKAIGIAIINGISGALALLGLTALLYLIFDRIWLNPIENQLFLSQYYLYSAWDLFVISFLMMFMIGGALYGSFLSWIADYTKKEYLLTLSGGIAFALFSSFWIDTSYPLLVPLFWILPGMAMTWLFLKHDVLTTLFTLFFFILSWFTVDGRFVPHSPDILLAWGVFAFMAILLGVGLYLINKGNEYGHIPELTPAYIRQISREQRVKRELEIAHQVHQSFLPVQLPSIEGIEVAAQCYPAFDVGGDYYDVIPLNEHNAAIIIGDVSGKGIQSAFFMTMVKGIFQSLVKEIPEPIPLLTRINRLFYDNARRGSFISVCYALLDTQKGIFRYARAGHNPVVLIRADGSPPVMLRPSGIAIGLTRQKEFEKELKEERIELQKGDTIVFYTDGITEALNTQNEMFGDQRLLETLHRHRSRSVQDLLDSLKQNVIAFSNNLPIHDDMTAVVIRYTTQKSTSMEEK